MYIFLNACMYEYSQLNIYLDERAKVIDRMYKKDGFEMRRNLKVSKGKYPQVFITKKTTYLQHALSRDAPKKPALKHDSTRNVKP